MTETVPGLLRGRPADHGADLREGRAARRSGDHGPGRSVDGGAFRRALAVHAAGVVVITAQSGGVPAGMTATSFSSVSLDPPLVAFYVDQDSTTWPRLRAADHFAVNILGSDQAELAARFAGRGVDRFAAPTRWSPGPLGAPLLRDVSAHLVCLPYETTAVGDHILVVGLVAEAVVHGPGRPLLYHQGRFGRFIPHP
ncbi:flavin reductase family protein [Planomonospora venezuelensis]|uniref:Flavin reductase (DIM6/NTAB) family NADH-FMN oxidoreductase RutF n=1 Tax=Planomonospora venezuelensis TaxID=1999 RepID=A0A841DDV2_PLAVE|nr:flavin reductase family protein [Planomonospora venezuelensis]MBB5967057.1 flavin reductase (DIM6/NTAB) family NADH-FMN oxidoreductase RutF [Planomonospora venezuelensis]GIN04897.1 flavin-dependent reductase [Planomonospora venezuelensis]